MAGVLGLDTSNYTTSAAWFDGTGGDNTGKLLEVPQGALGLRQSEALFQHVKRLPAILEDLKAAGLPRVLTAIGASTRPREVEGSYMPCFWRESPRERPWHPFWKSLFTPAPISRDILPPRRGPQGEWIYWISRIWSGISPAARQSYCTWCQMALWCRRPASAGPRIFPPVS